MSTLFYRFFIIVTILVMADHILYWTVGISLAGYAADQILFWGWLVLTLIAVILNIKKRSVWITAVILIVVSLAAFVPILFTIGSIFPLDFSKNICEVQLNKDYTLRTETKMALAHPNHHLIKSLVLLEKDLGHADHIVYHERDTTTKKIIDSLYRYPKNSDELCNAALLHMSEDVGSSKIEVEVLLPKEGAKIVFKQ